MANKKGRRKFWLAFILGLVVLGSSAYILGWSSILSVKKVIVVGAPNPSEAFAIQRNFRIGDKMARIESQQISTVLKKYTWLDHAKINRNWLKGLITVQVWTRTPVGQFQNHLVDRNGVVFDLPNVVTTNLPVISGSDATAAKVATDLLFALPISLRSQVSAINVRGSDWAVLSVVDPKFPKTLTLVWGDLTDMSLKVKVYQALIALPENAKITYVDVSAPHAPIVR